jgi:hypothetical protein
MVFAGALLALPLNAVRAEGQAGTSSAQFLKLGAGARAAAMGDAFAAVADDASAVYWNPAGLTQLKSPEVTAMQNSGLVGTQYQVVAGALPVTNGALGISFYRMDYGSIDSFSASDTPEGSVSAGDLAAGLSGAHRFTDALSAGATVKFVQEKIDGTSASAFAGDAGLLWKQGRFSIGAAVQHLGSAMKFVKESESLPTTLRADAAARVTERLVVAAGVAKARDNDAEVHAGAEVLVGNVLSVRGGYAVVPGNTADYGGMAGVSGGIGLALGRFSLDYAIRPFGDLGLSHRISLTARFGAR